MVAPFDQRKLYEPAGVTLKLIEPFPEMQDVFGDGVPLSDIVVLLLETVALAVAVQPPPFVAVTVYVPAETPDKSSVAAPFDQLKV